MNPLKSLKYTAVLLAAFTGLQISAVGAEPLYRYAFGGGSVENTGSAKDGKLEIVNSQHGGVAVSSNEAEGFLDLTVGQVYLKEDPAGVACGNVGDMGTVEGLTVAFWFKPAKAALEKNNNARLLVLGGADAGAPNSVGITISGSARLNLYVNGADTTNLINLGSELEPEVWYFVAFTYDGASPESAGSTLQQGATADANGKNGQLYFGTADGAVSDIPVKVGLTPPDYKDTRGSLIFTAGAKIRLGNRADLQRGFNGSIDNVAIFNEVLSQNQVEELRKATTPR